MEKNKYQSKFKLFQFKKLKLTTREITFGAIFAASTVAFVILLITYVPLVAYPTVRVAFEGVLIKMAGYLFGPLIGVLSGGIAELLVNLLRPTYFHYSWTITIILYGLFAGIIRYMNAKSKEPEKLFFVITGLISIIFTSIFTGLILHNGYIPPVFGIQFDKIQIILIVLITQFLIIGMLPFFSFLTKTIFKKWRNFYLDILPIFLLSVFTGYFLTIPITPLGDTHILQVSYLSLFLVYIVTSPLNIIGNIIVIYLVYKIMYPFISRQQTGKYSEKKLVFDLHHSPFDDMYDQTKKHLKLDKDSSQIIYYYQNLIKKDLLKNKKIILITGTNGKSSVSTYIYRYLLRNEKKVGLFISPHIYDWTERIQFNGSIIKEYDFLKYYKKVSKYTNILKLKTFDVLALCALHYFDENKAEYLILECGIGARRDIIGGIEKGTGAITNISQDHRKHLGNNKLAIAHDKSYIIKPNSDCFINESDSKILDIYKLRCREVNAKLYNLQDKNIAIKKYENGYKVIRNKSEKLYKNINLTTITNLLFAEQICNSIITKDSKEIINNIYPLSVMGRNTKVSYARNKFIIDSSHNFDGIKKFLDDAIVKKQKYIIYTSFSSDKETDKIIKLISSYPEIEGKINLCQNSSNRSINPGDFKSFSNVKIIKNFEQSISSLKTDKTILVFGSFYFISDFLLFLKSNQ